MVNRFRNPVSGLTHLAAAVAAACGLVILLFTGRDSAVKEISLFIYGLSQVLMFSASAAYHLVKSDPKTIEVLRKFDHSAIYISIAGTYTPICLNLFHGFWKWGLVGIIWSIAIIGITIKFFIIDAPRWLYTGIYLLMGWIAIIAIKEILVSMPAKALFLLVLGGIFYTLGAVGYIAKKPDFYPGVFGFHEVWHIFVILGSASHFILIATFIAPVFPS